MTSKSQKNDPFQIIRYASLYGKFYYNLQKSKEVLIVSGPQKAGKSVSIDLLTDKKLQAIEPEDLQARKFVSEEKNYQAKYSPIYFQFLETSKTLVIEGLTLSIQKNKNKVNIIKSIFIKACLAANKNISFIIVSDQNQREQQENLNILLDHMFQCLNISDQEVIKEMSKNFYLLLTKTQEKDAIQQFKKICEDLQQAAQNQGVKAIISDIDKHDKIRTFPNDDPVKDLGKQLRSAFKPSEVSKKVVQYTNKNKLNQEMVKLLQSQRPQIIDTFNNLLILVKALSINLAQKAPNQTEFQAAINKFYSQLKIKEFSLQNLKGTSWQGLIKLTTKQRISRQQIQNQKGQLAYKSFIEYISMILKQLEAKALQKEGYQRLIGILKFLHELASCLDDKIINDNISKLMESFDHFEKFFEKGQARKKQEKVEPKKIQGSKSPMNKNKKAVQKKPVNKAANLFKQQILRLSNNEEVIKACINKIKEKEAFQNYEVNDVIYYLKFLRELLESYDSFAKVQGAKIQYAKVQNRYFIEQLLDLYAFNENIYEFQANVKKYVQKREIPMAAIQRLIKKADQIKSYESQLRLINYAIANSYGDDQHKFLNKMKNMVRYKQHQQFVARSENKQTVNPEKRQCSLPSSLFDDIKQKADKSWLQSQNFKRLIQSSEND